MNENSKEETFFVEFSVYGEPKSKERPRTVTKADRYGREKAHTYTPSKTKFYEQSVGLVYKSHYGTKKFGDGVPLRAEIDFYLEIPKRTAKGTKAKMLEKLVRPTKGKDVDNLEKSVLDGLNKIAYKDDSQIVELIGRKFYSDKPRVDIRITAL